ncbi:MAG: STAS domain-containing protein [Armatimonadota bacterium]
MNHEMRSHQVEPGIAFLQLIGEADANTAPRLRQEVQFWLDQGVAYIVVDLSQITYIDSTNLGVLVGALKRAREKGGEVVIVSPSRRVVRLFEITGLGKVFAVYDSEATALRELRGNQDGKPGS